MVLQTPLLCNRGTFTKADALNVSVKCLLPAFVVWRYKQGQIFIYSTVHQQSECFLKWI